jgi:hypothetical protein
MGINADPGVKARGPQTWEGVGAMLLFKSTIATQHHTVR